MLRWWPVAALVTACGTIVDTTATGLDGGAGAPAADAAPASDAGPASDATPSIEQDGAVLDAGSDARSEPTTCGQVDETFAAPWNPSIVGWVTPAAGFTTTSSGASFSIAAPANPGPALGLPLQGTCALRLTVELVTTRGEGQAVLLRLVTSGRTFELKRIGDNYHPLVDGVLPTGNVPVPSGSHTVGLDVAIDGALTLSLGGAPTAMPTLALDGNAFAITKLLLGIVEADAQQATVVIRRVNIAR